MGGSTSWRVVRGFHNVHTLRAATRPFDGLRILPGRREPVERCRRERPRGPGGDYFVSFSRDSRF